MIYVCMIYVCMCVCSVCVTQVNNSHFYSMLRANVESTFELQADGMSPGSLALAALHAEQASVLAAIDRRASSLLQQQEAAQSSVMRCVPEYDIASLYSQRLLFCDQSMPEKAWRSRKRGAQATPCLQGRQAS